MHKITSISIKLCGGLVTRLTGRREYVLKDGYLNARDGVNADFAGPKSAFTPTPVNRATKPPSKICRNYFMLVPKPCV